MTTVYERLKALQIALPDTRYARLIMEREPYLAGFFAARELRFA
jgi:hypothetical protein